MWMLQGYRARSSENGEAWDDAVSSLQAPVHSHLGRASHCHREPGHSAGAMHGGRGDGMDELCLVPLPLAVLWHAEFGSEGWQKELRGVPEGCWAGQLEETQPPLPLLLSAP